MITYRILKFTLSVILLWFFIHSIVITIDGLKDDEKSADVAVVLGSKVNEDGTLSDRLAKRVECGLNLYQSGRVKKVIVSGGFGEEGFYEGDKMKEFLVARGMPDSLIIVDNYGNNTEATAENTFRLKDEFHFNSVIVVSQYFHLTRTKMLFKKVGFKEVSSASPHYFEWRDIYALFREFAAYYKQLIL